MEILAGTCAAFIDRTRIQIEPVAEKELKTKIKYPLDPGEVYIVLEEKSKKSFEIFKDLVTHGILGLVVSREYPKKLKEEHNLQKIPMLWLSEIGIEGSIMPDDPSKLLEIEGSINPNDLDQLGFFIENTIKKGADSVILLDGLEYLITCRGFETMLKYLYRLKDKAILGNSRLIIPLNEGTRSSEELNRLKREFTIRDTNPPKS